MSTYSHSEERRTHVNDQIQSLHHIWIAGTEMPTHYSDRNTLHFVQLTPNEFEIKPRGRVPNFIGYIYDPTSLYFFVFQSSHHEVPGSATLRERNIRVRKQKVKRVDSFIRIDLHSSLVA
jgi:hypothetical protein